MSAPTGTTGAEARPQPVSACSSSELGRRGAGLLRTLEGELSAGDRLALLGNVGPDLLAAALVAREHGVSPVPLDSSFSLEETAYALNDSRARHVLLDPAHVSMAEQLRPLTPYVAAWKVLSGDAGDVGGAPAPIPAAEPAGSLHYSATVTGRPVGYAVPDARHPSGRRDIEVLLGGRPLGPDSTVLLATSPSDPAALLLAAAAYDAGADLILCDGVESPIVTETIARTQPSILHLSPVTALAIAKSYDGAPAQVVNPELALISVPGCAPSVTRTLIETWGAVVRLVYLAPGIGAVTAIDGVDVLLYPGSMGAPLQDAAALPLRVKPDASGPGLIQVEVPAGSDRWVSWGDRGVLSRGRLTVFDQYQASAGGHGRETMPHLVEAALVGHPSVADAAVVAGRGGASSRTYVQPSSEADVSGLGDRLIASLREQLPGAWVPERISVVPLLPRTATGKLDRRRLLALDPLDDLA